MIELAKKLVRSKVVRLMTGLDRKTRSPQDRGRRAQRLPQKRHVRRVVDGHEVVGPDVEPLERQKEERTVSAHRAAECRAKLLLRIGRLFTVDRLPGRTEALE